MVLKGAEVQSNRVAASSTQPALYPEDATRTQQVITRAAIEAVSPATDLSQLLVNQPNVNVVTSGNGNGKNGADIYLRGMNGSLINFTLDGIPINANIDGTIYPTESLPPADIGSVDVRPGAGSAATIGNANFAGSIALHSINPSTQFYIAPRFGYGSFNTRTYGGAINSGELFKDSMPTAIYVSADHTRSDGYFDFTQNHRNTFFFKSDSKVGPGHLTLLFFQDNQDWNIYNGATQDQIAQFGRRYSGYNNNPDSPQYFGYNVKNFLNWQSYAKYQIDGNGWKLSDQYYYLYGHGGGTSTQVNPSAPGGFYITQRVFPIQDFGNILKGEYQWHAVRLQAGAWIDSDHETAFYKQGFSTYNLDGMLVSSSPDRPVDTLSVQADWAITSRLTVTAGVKSLYLHRRYRAYDIDLERSVNFLKPLPSVGVNYAIVQGLHAYANYTRSAEAPSADQLTDQTFNSDLQPQTANSYELGMYWKRRRWSGRATAFRTDFQNYIVTQPVVIGSQVFSEKTNGGKAVFQGLELSNTYELIYGLSAFANVGILDARMTSTGQPALQAPHHTEAAGLSWRQHQWSGQLALRQIGGRYYATGTSGNQRVGGYTTGDLSVAWDSGRVDWVGVQDLRVSLYVNNILDRGYLQSATASTSSSAPAYLLSEPINAFVSVQAMF